MRRPHFPLAALVLTVTACATAGPPDVSTLQVSPSPSAAPTPSATPSDTAASPEALPSPDATPTATANASDAATTPSTASDGTAQPAPVSTGQNLGYYEVNPADMSNGSEPTDWQDVTGPAWLNHDPWTLADGVWHMPEFSGQQYAFRRYAGDAFNGDGHMPALYQAYIRIRPKSDEGTIAVCPYYVSPTQYSLVLLDLPAKTVSLWEMNGATPGSGSTGAYDLSQAHRGWRPLPAPDNDGAYSIKVKVNTQWNSLAVWIGDTWIDTPKVESVTDKPHDLAIRTSGDPQEILKIGINRFTDPLQAR